MKKLIGVLLFIVMAQAVVEAGPEKDKNQKRIDKCKDTCYKSYTKCDSENTHAHHVLTCESNLKKCYEKCMQNTE